MSSLESFPALNILNIDLQKAGKSSISDIFLNLIESSRSWGSKPGLSAIAIPKRKEIQGFSTSNYFVDLDVRLENSDAVVFEISVVYFQFDYSLPSGLIWDNFFDGSRVIMPFLYELKFRGTLRTNSLPTVDRLRLVGGSHLSGFSIPIQCGGVLLAPTISSSTDLRIDLDFYNGKATFDANFGKIKSELGRFEDMQLYISDLTSVSLTPSSISFVTRPDFPSMQLKFFFFF